MTESSNCKNWKSVRPWLPPNGLMTNRVNSKTNNDNHTNEEEEQNQTIGNSRIQSDLKVIDVSSTAISLNVSFFSGYQFDKLLVQVPISLSVKINGNIWKKVAYVESDLIETDLEDSPTSSPRCEQYSSQSDFESSRSGHRNGRRNIILVIHGLEPGLEYEVELALMPSSSQAHYQQAGLTGASEPIETPKDLVEHEELLGEGLDASIEGAQEAQRVSESETVLHEPLGEGEGTRENGTKTSEPIITHLEPDGPPPPYTSHDPASPRNTRTLQTSHSSLDYNPESSQQPLSPRTSSSNQPSSPVRTKSREPEGKLQTVVKTSEDNSKHNELKLVSSINQMTKALNKTVKENLKLRQKLVNVEQFIKRLDEENLLKSNRLESLERIEKKRRPSATNGQQNNSHSKKESEGETMSIEGFTPLWVLEREIELDESKIMEKQIELEECEKRQAKELMEYKDRNRSLRRKVEESFKRVSDLKDRKIKEIDLELEEIRNELEEVEKSLNAESTVNEPNHHKKNMGKSSGMVVKGHGDHQSRRSMGKWNSHAKMRSNEDLHLNVNSKSASNWGSTPSHNLARTSSLNEKSRTTERIAGGGRRSMKEPHQMINRTWADKVAGH